MAIQIIQRQPRQPTFGEQFGKNFGEGAGKAFSEALTNRQNEKEYQKENETYKNLTGRDLSRNPKIREKEVEYALKGQNESQKENLKFQNKSKEMGDKLAGEQKVHKELVSFADRLEASNPKFKGVADIYRLDIPLDQKTKIVQSITGTDIYREDQQRRLQMDSTLKRYNSRIKEIDDEIKNVRNPSSTGREEANELRRQRMALRTERDQLLDFRSLNGMDENFEDDEEKVDEIRGGEVEGPTVKFDSSNQKHRAVAKKLYEKYKDKEKVRQILSKDFKF